MKIFFKENWFKLGILITILIFGIFYITNYRNSDIKTVALKEKCLKDGNNFVAMHFLENRLANTQYAINVYNRFMYSPELKTCLVDISRITSPQHWYYAIIDIYTNQEIGSYVLDKTDKASWTSSDFMENYNKYIVAKNKYFPE